MLLFCVRDTTDLVVRAEAFEQAIPMDGSVATYDSRPSACALWTLKANNSKEK